MVGETLMPFNKGLSTHSTSDQALDDGAAESDKRGQCAHVRGNILQSTVQSVGVTPRSWTRSQQVRQTSLGLLRWYWYRHTHKCLEIGLGDPQTQMPVAALGRSLGLRARSSGDWIMCIILSMLFKYFLVRLCYGPKACVPSKFPC